MRIQAPWKIIEQISKGCTTMCLIFKYKTAMIIMQNIGNDQLLLTYEIKINDGKNWFFACDAK